MTRYSSEPIEIDAHNWFYEDKSGITLVHEVCDAKGVLIRTDQIKITWRKLKATMDRHQKIKRARAALTGEKP